MELPRESREFRALCKSYRIFKSGTDPDTLVTILFSRLMLTPEEKEKAKQKMLTRGEQLDVIFTCLEGRVSADPSVFHKLVCALLEEPVMEAVGKQMQG